MCAGLRVLLDEFPEIVGDLTDRVLAQLKYVLDGKRKEVPADPLFAFVVVTQMGFLALDLVDYQRMAELLLCLEQAEVTETDKKIGIDKSREGLCLQVAHLHNVLAAHAVLKEDFKKKIFHIKEFEYWEKLAHAQSRAWKLLSIAQILESGLMFNQISQWEKAIEHVELAVQFRVAIPCSIEYKPKEWGEEPATDHELMLQKLKHELNLGDEISAEAYRMLIVALDSQARQIKEASEQKEVLAFDFMPLFTMRDL